MPAFDAHIHAFQDDRTERASLDRLNRVKNHWRAYVQGRAELELLRNKQAILLSAWRAEDRALRSSRARPVVCSDCGARELEHFYTSKAGGYALCPRCFQRRVERGVAREANLDTQPKGLRDGLAKLSYAVVCFLGILILSMTPIHAQGTGKILVKCDSLLACQLALDGYEIGSIPAGKLKKISVELGEHLLEVRSTDKRFTSYTSEKTIKASPQQTVLKVRPLVAVSDLLRAALMGTVVTKIGRISPGGLGSPESIFFSWKNLDNPASWTQAGFLKIGDHVTLPRGTAVQVTRDSCLGELCYVAAEYREKEFSIFYQDLIFIDRETGADLTRLRVIIQ